jgi:hypothetical protein
VPDAHENTFDGAWARPQDWLTVGTRRAPRHGTDQTIFKRILRTRPLALLAKLETLLARLLAHAKQGAATLVLLREADRLLHVMRTVDRCSVGAAAITTSGFGLDRARVASLFGFAELQENAYGCIEARVRRHIAESCITITEVADTLVREEGISFRQAHELASDLARRMITSGQTLETPPLKDFEQAFVNAIGRLRGIDEARFRSIATPEHFVEVRDMLRTRHRRRWPQAFRGIARRWRMRLRHDGHTRSASAPSKLVFDADIGVAIGVKR